MNRLRWLRWTKQVRQDDDVSVDDKDGKILDRREMINENVKCSTKQYLENMFESDKFHKVLITLVLLEWFFVSIELLIDLYTAGHKTYKQNSTLDDYDYDKVPVSDDEHSVAHIAKEVFSILSLFILTLFVLEIVTKMCVYGKTFCTHKVDLVDTTIIFISFTLSIIFIHHKYLHYTEAIILLRIWNVLRLIHGLCEVEHNSQSIEWSPSKSDSEDLETAV